MSKGANNPNKTGQRCILCYAWEVPIENPKQRGPQTKIDHETYCPDYKR